ncbi:hypothetical protein NDU88_005656 [Pleurodeles waltl]|uniref:Uncharacterized protein n=1 Tax=Pleurodeles waltl TaxID=8319 RepID=A0AAV7NN36_PLEWA|nr:hypothetical protein NDU88_005656 [Pleurodeles waltl]
MPAWVRHGLYSADAAFSFSITRSPAVQFDSGLRCAFLGGCPSHFLLLGPDGGMRGSRQLLRFRGGGQHWSASYLAAGKQLHGSHRDAGVALGGCLAAVRRYTSSWQKMWVCPNALYLEE